MTDEEPNIAYILCKGVSENCINPDSYGYICVGCNQCGRFDETKINQIKSNYGRNDENGNLILPADDEE